MQVVILGKEESKVTDFFSIISRGKTSAQNRKLFGSVSVPDQRVDDLSDFFKPKKTTYTQLS
ncbi:MAG: redox-regulated ATPase YchF, partial [Caldisericia bacterium]|nr:redox-regulated ATPase YchF [Caldisericia bacterium]